MKQKIELIPKKTKIYLFLCSDFSSMMGGCMVLIDVGEGKSYAN
jgi:hypothetical protein